MISRSGRQAAQPLVGVAASDAPCKGARNLCRPYRARRSVIVTILDQQACASRRQNVSPWRGVSRAWGNLGTKTTEPAKLATALTPKMRFIKFYPMRAQQCLKFFFERVPSIVLFLNVSPHTALVASVACWRRLGHLIQAPTSLRVLPMNAQVAQA